MTSQRYSTLVTDEDGSGGRCRCGRRTRFALCFLLLLFIVFLIILIADPAFYGIGDNNNSKSDGSSSSGSHSHSHPNTNTNTSNSNNSSNSIPALNSFLTHEHIDSSFISKISKFRSGVGRDYSIPSNETCRSMKHYFNINNNNVNNNNNNIALYSPFDGIIVAIGYSGGSLTSNTKGGYQIGIKSKYYPDYMVIMSHVNINVSDNTTTKTTDDSDSDGDGIKDKYIELGDSVLGGQIIGTLMNGYTSSDIALKTTSGGIDNNGELYSLFLYMSDNVFNIYNELGVINKSELIISKEERDYYKLNCTKKGLFVNNTNLRAIDNWVILA